MTDAGRRVDEAIQRIASSDPIIKLLQEVKLGRMRPTDAGIRAIAESWVDTYRQALGRVDGADRAALLRLDPRPRLAVLVEAGVFAADHPSLQSLTAAFEGLLASAPSSTP